MIQSVSEVYHLDRSTFEDKLCELQLCRFLKFGQDWATVVTVSVCHYSKVARTTVMSYSDVFESFTHRSLIPILSKTFGHNSCLITNTPG